MIRYVIDSSGLWRVLRDKELRAAWSEVVAVGAVGSCHPQRTEFKASARDREEFDAMTDMFGELYPDVPVPKSAWQWAESTQYRLTRSGAHRALSVVDLLVAATAVHHGLTVLHDDRDFATLARALPEVLQRNVHDQPW
ncbi:PIN domain-containing protein [Streptomyces sp. PTM05]|uniref:Ribonuclease VapC n=1 Tax=Streptantibioticus parmotrematis TaxID=2873249 RepID=A0ABS7QNA8_9ACTN|nr:PIN domain-containing protein [Streptantibioticus parmotrematis]MBY8884662.1 PIN domain-containing protein [Streptantibioticus parmotrematis]